MTFVIVYYKTVRYICGKLKYAKYILSVIALVAILFHSGAYTAVFVNFQFNQDFIAAKLCENRFSPELKCEGKCYLKKQFNTQSQQNNEHSLLNVQQTINWVVEADEVKDELIFAENTAAPAAYFQAFFTQHNTAPRPHPPSQA